MQLGKVLLLVNLLFDNNYPPHPIAIYLGAKSSIIHYNNEKYLNLLLQKYSTPFLFLLKVQNVTLLSYFCAYCDYFFFLFTLLNVLEILWIWQYFTMFLYFLKWEYFSSLFSLSLWAFFLLYFYAFWKFMKLFCFFFSLSRISSWLCVFRFGNNQIHLTC